MSTKARKPPTPIKLTKKAVATEYAWVIERGDSPPSSPTYYTGGSDGWSQDHLDAIRFSRKQDAERAAYHLRWPNCRIAEHGWG